MTGLNELIATAGESWQFWTAAALVGAPVTIVCVFLALKVVHAVQDARAAGQTTGRAQRAGQAAPVVRHEQVVKLSPEQEEKKSRGEELIAHGKILEGARLLEEVTFHRSAIDALEKGGYIDEACAVLLRIKRPNRAAILFQRNKQHLKAAQHFVLANLFEDAAKEFLILAKEDFRYLNQAAEAFERAQLFNEARQVHSRLLNTQKVLDLCLKDNDFPELALTMQSPRTATKIMQALSPSQQQALIQGLPREPLFAQIAADWISFMPISSLLPVALVHFQSEPRLCGFFLSLLKPAVAETVLKGMEANSPLYESIDKNIIAKGFLQYKLYTYAAHTFRMLSDWRNAAIAWAHANHLQNCIKDLQALGRRDVLQQAQIYANALQEKVRKGEVTLTNEQLHRNLLQQILLKLEQEETSDREKKVS